MTIITAEVNKGVIAPLSSKTAQSSLHGQDGEDRSNPLGPPGSMVGPQNIQQEVRT